MYICKDNLNTIPTYYKKWFLKMPNNYVLKAVSIRDNWNEEDLKKAGNGDREEDNCRRCRKNYCRTQLVEDWLQCLRKGQEINWPSPPLPDITPGHSGRDGQSALIQVPACQRKKLDLKTKEVIFVGYSEDPNGYYFRDSSNPRSVQKSRDVTFFEDNFSQLKGNAVESVKQEPIILFDEQKQDETVVHQENNSICSDDENDYNSAESEETTSSEREEPAVDQQLQNLFYNRIPNITINGIRNISPDALKGLAERGCVSYHFSTPGVNG
ncbi:Retrovirus-related Pol polyprotein from transposon TNT 1-94 [Operophtera brumata]|uniref:Retrovirus-related Pol polyprotein from transposon TNT 1-94 n=1 Tax=Operophtera brumata TaxID=104452 RepID=A0A0L7LP24_OPEBR|nr:Retrovirus-related Pol polyprotein from transposon TNT 1-94 [Operophtera brumata]